MPTPPKWMADLMADKSDLPGGLAGPALDMSIPGALEAFMAEQNAMYDAIEAEELERIAREKAGLAAE